jgi:hypothetical protein
LTRNIGRSSWVGSAHTFKVGTYQLIMSAAAAVVVYVCGVQVLHSSLLGYGPVGIALLPCCFCSSFRIPAMDFGSIWI